MSTAVGIAHADYAYDLVRECPGLVDFVEIPFEQLVRMPSAVEIKAHVPVILHCASLSIAGNLPPDDALIEILARWIKETETPWLGEHLAYVRTKVCHFGDRAHEAILSGSEPFNVGYTVSPQFSPCILDRVVSSATQWEDRLGLPVLLENGPVYFNMPGSTMSQLQFIQKLCARRSKSSLLLDLSHLTITCANLAIDPIDTLLALPLESVVEVHMSGTQFDDGTWWDDHSRRVPEVVFELLTHLRGKASPRALTLEYNWDGAFPIDVVAEDVERVRRILSGPL
ncbi:DUF692 family protein [Paraburkholderia strydomiana]|uniref:multinuclear nonheme iron-dependent oxidase n=1 Tax=Paraburkholderia strydomiana TaxID=1245417 RepID=UPI0038B73CAB